MRLSLVPILSLPLLLAGCSLAPTATPSPVLGAAIHGTVHGGQQPIIGSHIYLFAAGTTGFGNSSTSLLDPLITKNSDSIGAYVLTQPDSSFTLTGDYACVPNSQVYIYALGGNTGAGINSAAGLLAALGNCPATGSFAAQDPFVSVNEVSTIAAAYAFSGYAFDATHVSSSATPLGKTGIANAFASATNLANLATGTAYAKTPAGNGTVPQAEINTLADILASCINSSGSTSLPCGTLFKAEKFGGPNGVAPTDTASAAINIAHNPTITSIFSLQGGAGAPFQPVLTASPNDFTLSVAYSGGGIVGPNGVAIDAAGNAFISNSSSTSSISNGTVNTNTIVKLSTLGVPLSGPAGYSGGGLNFPTGVAIDPLANLWASNFGDPTGGGLSLSEFSNSGVALSTDPLLYTGGGLAGPLDIAIDPSGNAWAVNVRPESNGIAGISKFSPTGAALSPATGYQSAGLNPRAASLAIDSLGNVWVPNTDTSNTLIEIRNDGGPITDGGFTGGGLNNPYAVAIDHSNHVWVTNQGGASISEFGQNGSAISTSTGFKGGGLNTPNYVAIDGAGNVWVDDQLHNIISEFSNAGVSLSGSGFGTQAAAKDLHLAIDGSGNVWYTSFNDATVVEIVGAAVPVVTPIVSALTSNPTSTLVNRP